MKQIYFKSFILGLGLVAIGISIHSCKKDNHSNAEATITDPAIN